MARMTKRRATVKQSLPKTNDVKKKLRSLPPPKCANVELRTHSTHPPPPDPTSQSDFKKKSVLWGWFIFYYYVQARI